MIKQIGSRPQTRFDVPETLPISKLGERHAEELVPTRETTHLVIALVPSDDSLEFIVRNPLQELSKNELFRVHPLILAHSVLREIGKLSLNREQSSKAFSPCVCKPFVHVLPFNDRTAVKVGIANTGYETWDIN
jgi:hypothetical protein